MGTAVGPRRDARAILLRLIHGSTAMLTVSQIVARTGLSRPVVWRHLGELEAAGTVGRLAGKPQRWYWRGDGEQVA